ncbi:unnamed protein product [Lactuca saligna]|uniref:Uncharacterized protein n=1 Tax=Lactuca saligna TaxID=75948 RepID=A0AA36A4M5_LACSI|nr:unnamed protein product [Lactuca saligna]
MELVIEFLAMGSFAWKDGIFVEDNLSFCLGGERHTLSLDDFMLKTQIYLPSEVRSESYQQYIAGHVRITEGFIEEAHWNEIANGAYDKGTTQESDICSPLHRLLHRHITNTINQKQEGDKCPMIDMFFLWALITPDVYISLPFLLVDFLVARSGKDKRGSPLYGGMLITRLACSFGVLGKRDVVILTVEYQNHFSTLLYKRATIFVHGMGGFSIPDDTPRGRVPRRVRQRRDPEEDEPLVVPTDDELPMDPYTIALRKFYDNLERSANYTNMSLDHLMEQMHVTRPTHFPYVYPYAPSSGGESNKVEQAVVEEVMMGTTKNESSILLFYWIEVHNQARNMK